MKYYLNLGSNLGNRRLHLTRAIKAIGEEFGSYEASDMVESAPWGFGSTNHFANIGLSICSDLDPEEVLRTLQRIERTLSATAHRHSDGSYADREIDIDIMASDGPPYESETLRIPHRHLPERDFFLRPLAQLAPDWHDPVSGKTAMQMAKDLENGKR